jgi:hypothetical protein
MPCQLKERWACTVVLADLRMLPRAESREVAVAPTSEELFAGADVERSAGGNGVMG